MKNRPLLACALAGAITAIDCGIIVNGEANAMQQITPIVARRGDNADGRLAWLVNLGNINSNILAMQLFGGNIFFFSGNERGWSSFFWKEGEDLKKVSSFECSSSFNFVSDSNKNVSLADVIIGVGKKSNPELHPFTAYLLGRLDRGITGDFVKAAISREDIRGTFSSLFGAIEAYINALGETSKNGGATGGVALNEKTGQPVPMKHSCVTNPRTIGNALGFVNQVKSALDSVEMPVDDAVVKHLGDILELLAGRPRGEISNELMESMEFFEINLDGLHAYCHCLHTEAQLQVLMNRKMLPDKGYKIISWKLPCISCIHLLFLRGCISYSAHSPGLTKAEAVAYPAPFSVLVWRSVKCPVFFRGKRRGSRPQWELVEKIFNPGYQLLPKREDLKGVLFHLIERNEGWVNEINKLNPIKLD
jgi:hypothetical protein